MKQQTCRRHCRQIFFFAMLLHASALAADPNISQTSSGSCSPPIVENAGTITVNCPGIDREAVSFLEHTLTEQFQKMRREFQVELGDAGRTTRNLNDLISRLQKTSDDWASRYQALSQRLDDSPKSNAARDLMRQGKFDEAQKILESIVDKEEHDVDRAAETQFDLGQLASLKFDSNGALRYFSKAYAYRPDHADYARQYGIAALNAERFTEATAGLSAAERMYRDLCSKNPENSGYQEQLASVRYSEGLLFGDLDSAAQQINAYTESVKIYESLLKSRLNVDFELALAINGYAGAIAEGGQDEQAIGLYDKMIALLSGRDATEPAAHGTLVAIALFSKAGSLYQMNRLDESEQSYLATLSQLRTLIAVRPDLKILKCRALLDLAALYKIREKWPEAAAQYASAVEIWRDLNTNGIYKSELATALNSQGTMEANSGQGAPAIQLFKEAVALMRETSAQDVTLRPFLAFGLLNLAGAYEQQHQIPDAILSFKEAQAIFDEGGRKGSKDLSSYARHLKSTIHRLEGTSRKRH